MDDGFLPMCQRRSVTIEVREIPAIPDSTECIGPCLLGGCVELLKSAATESNETVLVNMNRQPLPSTGVKELEIISVSLPVQDGNAISEKPPMEKTKPSTYENKRVKMQLPPFSSLGLESLTAEEVGRQSLLEEVGRSMQARVKMQHSHSRPPYPVAPQHRVVGVVPPPTPPEDQDAFKWNPTTSGNGAAGVVSVPTHGEAPNSRGDSQAIGAHASSNRPSSIDLPPIQNLAQNNRQSSWLDRAMQIIVASRGDVVRDRQIQMVVQALPSQGKVPGSKPVFEEVAEILQQQEAEAPYITITHAVSQVISMDEVPASPPATPNNLNTSDNYFDAQTIFTHAAAVPSYHALVPLPSAHARANGIITAPSSTHVSTLERYIPPTTPQEVRDFFSVSRRSYLVDRLAELSAKNGTLLLVYPTAAGATTFARKYIGPVIDPFLRQFCLLNNLTTDAAARLGKTAALPAMMDFEAMSDSLRRLCLSLTHRAPAGREPKSGYHVIHAERVEITIERATWVDWFVEQETARLRQDMIDYQKAGGRMPARGFDATPGSMAREVVEGIIKNSREVSAGNIGIEVGVFVLRRSML